MSAPIGEPSNYCGRLDPHPPHEWLGRDRYPSTPHIIRECPGRPEIEGGNPAALEWPR